MKDFNALLELLASNAHLAWAGECYPLLRMNDGWRTIPRHPEAPAGISYCHVCGRMVIRGWGRWWE